MKLEFGLALYWWTDGGLCCQFVLSVCVSVCVVSLCFSLCCQFVLSVCLVSLCCQFVLSVCFSLCCQLVLSVCLYNLLLILFLWDFCKNFRTRCLLLDFTNDGTFMLLQYRFQWNLSYIRERPQIQSSFLHFLHKCSWTGNPSVSM